MRVQGFKKFDLGVRVRRFNRIDGAVKHFRAVLRSHVYRDLVVRGLRNGADGSDSFKQGFAGNFFGIR